MCVHVWHVHIYSLNGVVFFEVIILPPRAIDYQTKSPVLPFVSLVRNIQAVHMIVAVSCLLEARCKFLLLKIPWMRDTGLEGIKVDLI